MNIEIILMNVNHHERGEAEEMMNKTMSRDELNDFKNKNKHTIQSYPILDFADLVNDQVLDVLSEDWMTHVWIED
jgi:hypothetical protein